LTVTGKSTLGGNVTTTGEQSYSDLVTLGANSTLAAGNNHIILTGGVNGNGHALGLTSSEGNPDAIQTGAISGVTNLTVSGRTTLNGNVSTTGTQSYVGRVTLAGNTTLQGTSLSFTNLYTNTHAVTLRTNALSISDSVVGAAGSTATFTSFSDTGSISVEESLPINANTLQLTQATLNEFQGLSSITIGDSAGTYTIAFGDFVLPTTTRVRSAGNISFDKLDGAKALDVQAS